jgi:hypothetical protein
MIYVFYNSIRKRRKLYFIQLQMSSYQEEERGRDVTIAEYAKLPTDVSRFVCKQGDIHTV